VARFERERIVTPHTHGTGCTLSGAVAAFFAQGLSLRDAIDRAKTYVWNALEHGLVLGVGTGRGPVDHLFGIRDVSKRS
jgi:hydroxymethylpyrimidine/phosphomethylpyrimidine kinase